MDIRPGDIGQRLREARWRWWAPAAILVGICLLPSGTIEASPGEFYHPPVWMAPMGWPLLAMAVLFAGAAFSDRLRARPWHIVLCCAATSLLLELGLVVFQGSLALYSLALGTDLKARIFVDFRFDVLAFAIMPMDLLLFAISALVLWVRHGRPAPARPAPPFPPAPLLPLPPAVAAPPAPAVDTAPLVPAVEGPPPGGPAGRPAAPLSPLDAITPAAQPAAPASLPDAIEPATQPVDRLSPPDAIATAAQPAARP